MRRYPTRRRSLRDCVGSGLALGIRPAQAAVLAPTLMHAVQFLVALSILLYS